MTKKYMPCPCESKLMYHKCCKIYHDGAVPETAEKLMRSRYTAYALGNADYIMDTTHPENYSYASDRKTWKEDILRFCAATRFFGLRIIETAEEGEFAFVTFHANLAQNSKDASFTERSKFAKVDDRWMYHSGDLS